MAKSFYTIDRCLRFSRNFGGRDRKRGYFAMEVKQASLDESSQGEERINLFKDDEDAAVPGCFKNTTR